MKRITAYLVHITYIESQGCFSELCISPNRRIAGTKGAAWLTDRETAEQWMNYCLPDLKKRYKQNVELEIKKWTIGVPKGQIGKLEKDTLLVKEKLEKAAKNR